MVGRSCICSRLQGTPSSYGGGVIMGVFCHYGRGKVVYEHVLGGLKFELILYNTQPFSVPSGRRPCTRNAKVR